MSSDQSFTKYIQVILNQIIDIDELIWLLLFQLVHSLPTNFPLCNSSLWYDWLTHPPTPFPY